MKRRRRTEILINGSQKRSEDMAHVIHEHYQLEGHSRAGKWLSDVESTRDFPKSLFYPGEVLVTECKVQIEETIGIGIVTGDQPELSYNLAVIDAAFEAKLPEAIGWMSCLKTRRKSFRSRELLLTNLF